MTPTPRLHPLATSSHHDGIAVITLDNPPVNALLRQMAEEAAAALRDANADESVRAIVMIGAGVNFVAGVDIRELQEYAEAGQPAYDLYALPDAIAHSPKPVVAAIAGSALGGGLEIALAAHYRVTTPMARLGLPEVKLGLIPGMAGTQRLPRLVGMRKAAEMCCWGESVSGSEALACGLVDRLIDHDLLEQAVAFAREAPVRAASEVAARVDLTEIAERLRGFGRYGGAPRAAFEAVRGAALSLSEGIEIEKRLFRERLRSLEAKAMMRAFFGERSVGKVRGAPREIARVGVVGGGLMGSGIATACLMAGFPVKLKEVSAEAMSRAEQAVRANLDGAVTKGKLAAGKGAEAKDRFRAQVNYEGFDELDLVIEAVFESLPVKRQVFTELARVVSPTCLLATNTSSLDVDAITAAVPDRGRVLGLHFFSPAHVSTLVEVVKGAQTSAETLATGMTVAKKLGKLGVKSRNAAGFIGNRVFAPYIREARQFVEDGVPVERINAALVDWGMAMGPLDVDDLIGLDVSLAIEGEFERRLPGSPPPSPLLRALVERGHLGRKSGGGWVHAAEIVDRRGESDTSDARIVERCIGALIDEAQRVVAEGVAADGLAVDMVFLRGFGFPAWRGGPAFLGEHGEGAKFAR